MYYLCTILSCNNEGDYSYRFCVSGSIAAISSDYFQEKRTVFVTTYFPVEGNERAWNSLCRFPRQRS